MKYVYVFLILLFFSCNTKEETKTKAPSEKPSEKAVATPQVNSNERFKDVTVTRVNDTTFVIKGKGQIFEASFSLVIEDGHNELKQGFEMTDAGAPEWGNFSFTVSAVKERPQSTLHLILFESSAKDGSRQYELPLFLY